MPSSKTFKLSSDQFIPSGRKKCSLLHTNPDRSWSPPSHLYNGYWGFFMGTKQLGHGIDHPLPCRAKAKKEKGYTAIRPPCLHGMLEGDLSLYLQANYF
jgi:hypothetical protein